MTTARYPASDQQTQYWFLHALAGGRPVFNDPFVGRLRGPLSMPAFRASVTDVVARHEVLRTTFASEGGQLWQRVHDDLPVRVADPLVVGAEEQAWRNIAQACDRPFRLGADAPLRVTLYQLAPREHLTLFLFHHIATDAWTIELLLNEWAERYAMHARESAGPPPPAGQYREYAAWQRDAAEVRAALAYWCAQLRGAVLTELPPAAPDPRPDARLRRTVPAELAAACASLARAHHASPFMVYLAGFLSILRETTGRADLLIGLNAGNRSRLADARVAGPFTNMLPLRVAVASGRSFSELVRLVRDRVLAAYTNEQVPFGDLVSAMREDGVWPARVNAMPITFTATAPTRYPTRAGELDCHWRLAPFDPGASATGIVLVLGGEPDGRGVTIELDRRHTARQVDDLLSEWWRVLADGVIE